MEIAIFTRLTLAKYRVDGQQRNSKSKFQKLALRDIS